MKVILKETITGLGAPGDLVNVKAGYGRNFLMPSGKAIPATEENLKVYEAEKAQIAEIENKKITKITNLQNVKIAEIASYKNHLYFIVEDGSSDSSKYPINYVAYLNLEDTNNIKKIIAGASFYTNLKISNLIRLTTSIISINQKTN